MNLEFLGQKFNEKKFEEFISTAFDEFEFIDGNYRTDDLNKNDKEHITKYKYLGETFLDDNSEVGVLILHSATKNIENKRVGFSKVVSKLSKPYGKEIILVAIYHEESPIWRLTFVSYDFKDRKQITRTDAKRYTYVMGEDIVLTTAKSRIGMLFDNTPTSQETIEDIFSVEKVSKEFFDKYKILYANTLKELQPQIALFGDEKGLSLFTKKLLGRIVFLYFLQKKGWLASDKNWENGDKKFLRACFDGKYREYNDFYTEILQPLFFEALNEDRAKDHDNFELLNVHIPYLNGGLFMRDEFDKEDRVILENSIFENIFGLFDQYNFTIIESNPNDSEVAIDPEMLGRIFEDLLEDRKEKGAFYTPREIVHYMCKESIQNYLKTKPTTEDDLSYIKNIKVLDPAIGSGAFPMGMLHELIEIRQKLNDKTPLALMKKEIIQNSIYGVDIEESAVEIAKLRFWLSIIVDEEKPTPLPNLLYKIRVGNSLIEKIYDFNPLESELHGTKGLVKKLPKKIDNFFQIHNKKEKEKLEKDIEEDIDKIFINGVEKFQEENDLFNTNQKLHDKLVMIAKIIREYKKSRATTELFLYQVYFADIMNNGGFDVVIGNPPYVRHEKIKELKPKLKAEGYKSYNGTADLYIYFFEQGYRLLKENGILSYITSNTYVNARYAKDFREFIIKNINVLSYIDFSKIQLFDTATVATSIFILNKNSRKNKYFKYCDTQGYRKDENLEEFVKKNNFDYLQNDLKKEGFIFTSKQELEIKKIIDKKGKKLKSEDWNIQIKSGIKTGFNQAFIIDGALKDELISKDNKNSEIIKPLLRGRDIKRYSYEFGDKWLINLHNNPTVNINEYPSLKEYLDGYIDKLKSRSDKGNTPYNLRNCAYLDDFEKDKIVWLELSDNAKFTLDRDKYLLEMTVFFINGDNLKYLLALLNSRLIYWYFNLICAESGVGTNRWKKIYVEQLPIPKIPKEQQKPFEILVDYILFAKEQNMSLEASLFESVIDGMVYDLYFEEEMKRGDCFISDEVNKVIIEFNNSIDRIKEMYKILNTNKTIGRGLIYSRIIPVVEIINGASK